MPRPSWWTPAWWCTGTRTAPASKSLDEAALSLRIERRQDWFQVGALALDEHQILDLRLILRQLTPGSAPSSSTRRPA